MTYKTLYILRHAKAVPGNPGEDDHERALSARGEQDALKMGYYCRDEGILPKLVLCSTALRTRQTLHFLEQALDRPLKTHFSSQLYLASTKEILAELAGVSEEIHSVMIIGHNPTFHQLTADMTGQGDAKLLDALAQKFPTATLAEVQFHDVEWYDLGPKKGTLKRFMMPSELRASA